jgi:hypothetical protein
MNLRRFLGNFAKAYLAIGALSVSAFAAADDYHNFNSCAPVCAPPCAPSSCCGAPCNEPPACGWAYNPPAYARCGCETSCNGFSESLSGSVDFLWWRANAEGLQLGTEETVSTFTTSTDHTTVLNTSRTKKPNFKYDAGFRIGLINHCACDCYDVALKWTHFHTKAHVRGFTPTALNTAADTTTFYSDWERIVGANATEAEGRYTLNLDLIDLELGRKFYVSNCFVLRPSFGLRGVRIYQNYHVESSSSTGSTPDTVALTDFTSVVKARSDQLAIGPRLGLDIEVHLGCGVVLFGEAAGAIVFGKFDNHARETLTDYVAPTTPTVTSFEYEANSSAYRTSRTNTDLAIGIKWEHCYEWCNRLHPVSLAFAWEHHAFYNMNNFNFSPEGVTESDGTVVPTATSYMKHGDLYTQGLTVAFSFGF